MPRKYAALCLIAAFTAGCSAIKVQKSPDAGDTGVRFYRPKPYLLVTPAEPTGRMVNIKLDYLPDFNEEYSAHLKRGTSIALQDGWNLVSVNAKEAPKKEEKPATPIANIAMPNMVVAATNVPMGYYESVYEMSGPTKTLVGWRYIGFNILGGANPSAPGRGPGAQHGCGQAGSGFAEPLYGLVFFNGVMTFRRLEEIAGNQTCPTYIDPKTGQPPIVCPTQCPPLGAPQATGVPLGIKPENVPVLESKPLTVPGAGIESVPATTPGVEVKPKVDAIPPTPDVNPTPGASLPGMTTPPVAATGPKLDAKLTPTSASTRTAPGLTAKLSSIPLPRKRARTADMVPPPLMFPK